MTTRTHALEADLATISDVVNVGARTVVALPPSDDDPTAGEMRVYVGGTLLSRGYDATLVQP